jgi:hypothetical protein
MRQLIIPDGIFKRGGNMRLPYHSRKILRAVFPGRNNEFIHSWLQFTALLPKQKEAVKSNKLLTASFLNNHYAELFLHLFCFNA